MSTTTFDEVIVASYSGRISSFTTGVSYEEEDTCVSYEEEDTCVSYEEEDTCVSYEEEDTCVI